jgi:hypothetical protein
MITPFDHNRKGPLQAGELVRVYSISEDEIVLEKQYNVTTVEDMERGVIRHAMERYHYGKKKAEAQRG